MQTFHASSTREVFHFLVGANGTAASMWESRIRLEIYTSLWF